jgi:hypothetical protein
MQPFYFSVELSNDRRYPVDAVDWESEFRGLCGAGICPRFFQFYG